MPTRVQNGKNGAKTYQCLHFSTVLAIRRSIAGILIHDIQITFYAGTNYSTAGAFRKRFTGIALCFLTGANPDHSQEICGYLTSTFEELQLQKTLPRTSTGDTSSEILYDSQVKFGFTLQNDTFEVNLRNV